MHTGGQWLEEEVYFPMGDGNRGVTSVQVAGSTITYMRRYAVAAMLGIVADEDTDGNGQKQEQRKAAPPKQAPQAQPAPPASRGKPAAVQSEPPPVYDSKRTYADGSPVDANAKAVETYDAYVAAHDGKAPENVHNLRNWYKGRTNGNGKAAKPAPIKSAQPLPYQVGIGSGGGNDVMLFDEYEGTEPGAAAQPGLAIETNDAAKAASDTAAGLFG
jgi:hypothetical protein